MPLHLICSPRFALHVPPPGHPERPERNDVFEAVAARWRGRGGGVLEPRTASPEELSRVHAAHYVEGVAALAGRAVALDPDTYTSADSADVAALAAGAVCVAVERAVGHRDPVLVLCRPPGHHAERDKAMGFCLYNNAAVGAGHARALGLDRVAIVDIDVHHGNGTQWIFYGDPKVLYVSTHQFPYYPGSGAVSEIGRGAGTGYTINVPLEAGATDADFDVVFRDIVLPVLDHFGPEILIVSAGFDAHHRDPLASMRVSTEGYAAMMAHLHAFATTRAARRLVVIAEGGYDLQALSDCLDVTVEVLEADAAGPAPIHGDSARGREAVELVRNSLGPYWPALQTRS
jgi:acetoin utilization deacetylase AcuC-like enzyme